MPTDNIAGLGQGAGDERIRILIVDDDPKLRQLIGDFLRTNNYEVFEAAGGAAMKAVLNREAIDLVILDVMMPGEDGLALARYLSERTGVAVIMASALGSEPDRIIGLEAGADDYLPKPLSPRELLARIRAVLRRRQLPAEPGSGGRFVFEGWCCDARRRVLRDPNNVLITLSQGEFDVLLSFLEHPQRVLSRDQLLAYSRGDESDAFDRAIDTQVSRLRRKLATRTSTEFIRTVRYEGYMFLAKVVRR